MASRLQNLGGSLKISREDFWVSTGRREVHGMARKNEFPVVSGKSTSGYCISTSHTSTILSSGDCG
uniref:Uncharacterized protein n=1 Tax=Oryza meridionalis TaxID=40149 RepID=A0A0E0FE84_9ORYZ